MKVEKQIIINRTIIVKNKNNQEFREVIRDEITMPENELEDYRTKLMSGKFVNTVYFHYQYI